MNSPYDAELDKVAARLKEAKHMRDMWLENAAVQPLLSRDQIEHKKELDANVTAAENHLKEVSDLKAKHKI